MGLPEPLIVYCTICTIITNTAYGICAPLVPLEFKRHGIVSSWVGVTFALYALGNIVMSPFIGKQVDRIGHKNLIGGAIALMGISFFCFGFIKDMQNNTNIIVLAMGIRLLHGCACTTIYTTCMTVGLNEFPEKQDLVMGCI